ncbi:MAG: hypothetical protein H0U86_00060, partial [Chloroflexi bacterium]|nr:hypothetical protein [Chloroflexota bacterium]
ARSSRGASESRWIGRRWILAVGALVALALAGVAVVNLSGGGGGDTPTAWATLGTADVHSLAFDPDDSTHLLFGHHGGLLESRNGGISWQPATLAAGDAMNVRTTAGGRTQIAGHDLYVESVDGGASWQDVPNDLPGLDLHAFAVDPADPEHAWTFAAGFGLFETVDGGRQWELRQAGNWGALAAYRQEERTMLAAVGPDGLVSSADSGATWEALAYPGAPLAGGIAAAGDGSVLYAATGAGLRLSRDGGRSWEATGFDVAVLSVAVLPDDPLAVAVVDEATRFYRSADGGMSWPGP